MNLNMHQFAPVGTLPSNRATGQSCSMPHLIGTAPYCSTTTANDHDGTMHVRVNDTRRRHASLVAFKHRRRCRGVNATRSLAPPPSANAALLTSAFHSTTRQVSLTHQPCRQLHSQTSSSTAATAAAAGNLDAFSAKSVLDESIPSHRTAAAAPSRIEAPNKGFEDALPAGPLAAEAVAAEAVAAEAEAASPAPVEASSATGDHGRDASRMLPPQQLLDQVVAGVFGSHPPDDIIRDIRCLPTQQLMAAAAAIRDNYHHCKPLRRGGELVSAAGDSWQQQQQQQQESTSKTIGPPAGNGGSDDASRSRTNAAANGGSSIRAENHATETLDAAAAAASAAAAAATSSVGAAAAAATPAGNVITFSPKVFIPLTRLCRDSCSYCTFVQQPAEIAAAGGRLFMSEEEVVAVARQGAAMGCTEALFTLGDKPELKYAEAKDELARLGCSSTIEYVVRCCRAVLRATGMLPHVNAGLMGENDLLALREVSVSQGLMLESSAAALQEKGGAHFGCPDKVAERRLEMIEAAGRCAIPFTTGLLIGIGESESDRVSDILTLRQLQQRHGHIQEIIVQPFHPKAGTAMAASAPAAAEAQLRAVALSRIAFGDGMNIQAPPNLSNGPLEWAALIAAGINDFGGISPLTKDWVNPEAPWPHISDLAKCVEAAGKVLVPRLPVYGEYIMEGEKWLDPSLLPFLLPLADSLGFSRAQRWAPGTIEPLPPLRLPFVLFQQNGDRGEGQPAVAEEGQQKEEQTKHELGHDDNVISKGEEEREDKMQKQKQRKTVQKMSREMESEMELLQVGADGTLQSAPPSSAPIDREIERILLRAEREEMLSEHDITLLFSARGQSFHAICQAANGLRQRVNGDEVTYVVNRNINYTNICTYSCTFCAFSKGKASEELRGSPYLLDLDEIGSRAAEAWQRGATEVCMQGGIHPDFSGASYLDILRRVKAAAPSIHVHAFSPLEVSHGAQSMGVSVPYFLQLLKDEGLGSLPGTAAEILHDDVRRLICSDKLSSQEWLEVVAAAHLVGLRTTSTIMFGHRDHPQHWAHHLLALRKLQERTAGITEFVPLPFVHMQAPMFLKGKSRRGPTMRECVLMHAIARLVLHPAITNIQASWVKMGPGGAQSLLQVGCNDMGGSLMNESITRAAGAVHGQELPPLEMEKLIRSVGRIPRQRSTTYGEPPLAQVQLSLTT